MDVGEIGSHSPGEKEAHKDIRQSLLMYVILEGNLLLVDNLQVLQIIHMSLIKNFLYLSKAFFCFHVNIRLIYSDFFLKKNCNRVVRV